eukprot:jgi/Mesvir1/126/Mv07790-RA.1
MSCPSRIDSEKWGLHMVNEVRRSLDPKSPAVGRENRHALSEVTNESNAGSGLWKMTTPEKKSRIKAEIASGSPLGIKLKSILTPSKKRGPQFTVPDSSLPANAQAPFSDLFNDTTEHAPSSPEPQFDFSKRLSKVSALCHKVSADQTKLEATSAFQRAYIRFLEKERLQLRGQLAEVSALAEAAKRVHEEKGRLEGELRVQVDRRQRAEQREMELMTVVQSWGQELFPQATPGSARSTNRPVASTPGGDGNPHGDADHGHHNDSDAGGEACGCAGVTAPAPGRPQVGSTQPRHHVSCVWHGPAHAILRQAGAALTDLRAELASARCELEQSQRWHARLVAVAKAERVTSLVTQLGSACAEDRTRAVVTLADVTAASRSLSWDDLVLGAGAPGTPGAAPTPDASPAPTKGLPAAPDALVVLLQQPEGDGVCVRATMGADGSTAASGEGAGATDERHKLAIVHAGGAAALVALLRNTRGGHGHTGAVPSFRSEGAGQGGAAGASGNAPSLSVDGGLPLFQRSMAARVLANLCSKSGRCKAAIAQAGAIKPLMALLGEGVAALALASGRGGAASPSGGAQAGPQRAHRSPVDVAGSSPGDTERRHHRTPGCPSPATPRVPQCSPTPTPLRPVGADASCRREASTAHKQGVANAASGREDQDGRAAVGASVACACGACISSQHSSSNGGSKGAAGHLSPYPPPGSAPSSDLPSSPPCLHWGDAVTNASAALWSLSLSEGNRVRIAGSHRCVEDLVLLVARGPAECRPSAAAVLWNLALDAKHRPRLARAGAVPALVSLLVSGTPDGQAKAAGALGNLALDEGTRSAIRHAGGIPALISVLRLSHGGRSSNGDGTSSNGTLPSSSSSPSSSVLAAKVKAARALSCLAYHNEENRDTILRYGAAQHLLELCQLARYPEAKATAERALASLQWEVID